MTTRQKLQSVADDQRSKQSKLKQEAKAQREAILDDSDRIARLEILDKQIIQKEGAKKVLDSQIAKLEIDKEIAQDAFGAIVIKSALLQRVEDDKIAELYKKESVLSNSIAAGKKLLADTKTDIKVQADYFTEQQLKTDETINEWNAQLKDFQDAGATVVKEKDQINKDIIRLGQDKITVETSLKLIADKSTELNELYNKRASDYRDELKRLKADIQAGEQALLELELKNKARFEVADTREKSLIIRERAVQEQEFNLSSREKVLNMKLGLSQLNIS